MNPFKYLVKGNVEILRFKSGTDLVKYVRDNMDGKVVKWTQEQVNQLSEEKMWKLFETGKIDDDMAQRWYDYKEEVDLAVKDVLREFGILQDKIG